MSTPWLLNIHIAIENRHGAVYFEASGYSGTPSADTSSGCFHLTGWDCTDATTPQPFNFTETNTLYSDSFDCPQQGSTPGYAGDVQVNLTTNINGSMVFGWSLAGSFLHPQKRVEFYFGINSSIAGTLDLSANLNVCVL